MEGMTMEGILTVADLIEELQEMNQDAPVFIAVVKYPGEFMKHGPATWLDHDDVECIPLTHDEVINHHTGMVFITAELEEFSSERWMLNGNRAD